ncbi:hypothetical protein Bbelb_300020 [Branchiostoma belcheri]|nr:hypothetical protein Bbelb_300020 [Branchiostoma belcheri]
MRAPRVHERPPDGGWGWMILVSNFATCSIIFGVQKSFGVFFVEFREYFGETSGGTAWINSIMSAIAHGGGALAVPLSVRFGTRPVVMVGGVLSSLGLVLSTFANSVLYLYFSLGVLTGLSYAMVYVPSVTMLGRYFDKRRALVNGIALSGSGATFALAPICQLLEQVRSWYGVCIQNWSLSHLGYPKRVADETTRLGYPKRAADKATHLVYVPKRAGRCRNYPSGISNKVADKTIALGYPKLATGKNTHQGYPEQEYGWRGALLLLGGVTLNLCVSGALLRPIVLAADLVSHDPSAHTQIEPSTQLAIGTSTRESPEQNDLERNRIKEQGNFSRIQRKQFDVSLLKKRRFLLFASADLLSSFSYLIPYVHVVPCARYRGIDETKAPFLLSVAGITEVLARVFSGWFSDLKIISKLHVYMMFIGLNALACFLFPLATSYPSLLAYSVAMGTCTGGFRALIMPLVADTVGVVRMPNALGLTLVCEGVGILLGPPVAGWLYDATDNYNSSFFVAGGCFVASLLPLCGLSYLNRTQKRDSDACSTDQRTEPATDTCSSLSVQRLRVSGRITTLVATVTKPLLNSPSTGTNHAFTARGCVTQAKTRRSPSCGQGRGTDNSRL